MLPLESSLLSSVNILSTLRISLPEEILTGEDPCRSFEFFFSRSRLSSRDICWKGRQVWEVIGKGDFLSLTTSGLCITTEIKVPNQGYVCVILSLKHQFGIILQSHFLPGFGLMQNFFSWKNRYNFQCYKISQPVTASSMIRRNFSVAFHVLQSKLVE